MRFPSFRNKRATTTFRKGDSVVVKPGVVDPDNEETSLAGWQGRIVSYDENTAEIAWDSVTLRSMPEEFIEESEDQGMDWSVMYLSFQDVEPTGPRDTVRDVKRVKEEIEMEYEDYEGNSDLLNMLENPALITPAPEDLERVEMVLMGVDKEDISACLEAWQNYLAVSLVFPYSALVLMTAGTNAPPVQTVVEVQKMLGIGEELGIVMEVGAGKKTYECSLIALVPIDMDHANVPHLQAYLTWMMSTLEP